MAKKNCSEEFRRQAVDLYELTSWGRDDQSGVDEPGTRLNLAYDLAATADDWSSRRRLSGSCADQCMTKAALRVSRGSG